MKLISTFILGFLLTGLFINTEAQSAAGPDYFAGKWNVLIKGTPNGDTRMFFVLQKKDTAMTGVVQDAGGTEIAKISNIVLEDPYITMYFNASGYDVYVWLGKKDDDTVTGSLMDMFVSEGVRVKGEKDQ